MKKYLLVILSLSLISLEGRATFPFLAPDEPNSFRKVHYLLLTSCCLSRHPSSDVTQQAPIAHHQLLEEIRRNPEDAYFFLYFIKFVVGLPRISSEQELTRLVMPIINYILNLSQHGGKEKRRKFVDAGREVNAIYQHVSLQRKEYLEYYLEKITRTFPIDDSLRRMFEEGPFPTFGYTYWTVTGALPPISRSLEENSSSKPEKCCREFDTVLPSFFSKIEREPRTSTSTSSASTSSLFSTASSTYIPTSASSHLSPGTLSSLSGSSLPTSYDDSWRVLPLTPGSPVSWNNAARQISGIKRLIEKSSEEPIQK